MQQQSESDEPKTRTAIIQKKKGELVYDSLEKFYAHPEDFGSSFTQKENMAKVEKTSLREESSIDIYLAEQTKEIKFNELGKTNPKSLPRSPPGYQSQRKVGGGGLLREVRSQNKASRLSGLVSMRRRNNNLSDLLSVNPLESRKLSDVASPKSSFIIINSQKRMSNRKVQSSSNRLHVGSPFPS